MEIVKDGILMKCRPAIKHEIGFNEIVEFLNLQKSYFYYLDTGDLPENECHQNVENYVIENNAYKAIGYNIIQVEDGRLYAIFHSVVSHDGLLQDITKNFLPRILFAECNDDTKIFSAVEYKNGIITPIDYKQIIL
ncbi:MAG: hypothetical protein QXN55_00970 [Candidatus Nitrosotenuis sp.]